MTEPKYPRAWGVWSHRHSEWCYVFGDDDHRHGIDEEMANEIGFSAVVELIPLPEHEAIVAAAVSDERQRCARIVEWYMSRFAGRNAEAIGALSGAMGKIREVPE